MHLFQLREYNAIETAKHHVFILFEKTLTFAINYLQSKRAHLFENIFLILSEPQFSPHADS